MVLRAANVACGKCEWPKTTPTRWSALLSLAFVGGEPVVPASARSRPEHWRLAKELAGNLAERGDQALQLLADLGAAPSFIAGLVG